MADDDIQRKRVLVVDDTALDRDVMAQIVANAEMDVDVAMGGQQAIDLLQESPDGRFDAVVIDIYMPGRDGLEVIRALRRSGFTGGIIAVSGGGSVGRLEVLRAAEIFGADCSIAKPFRAKALLDCVRAACEKT